MSEQSLDWYTTVAGRTIHDVYVQELNRTPDWLGACNWLYWFRERNWTEAEFRAEIRKSGEWHAIHDAPAAVTLPRLVPSGGVFRLDTGERFTAIECSDFNLLGRYLLEGADAIRPVLEERADLGFNLLRVWAAYGPGSPAFEAEIGRLVPSEHPGLYVALTQFAALCASYGLYVELTAFTGGHIPGHWEKIATALQGVTNVIVELTNENNAHPGIDTNAYAPIPGIVCSRGSNGSQAIPPRPAWDYEAFHTNDASEWWRKGGHNGMELSAGAENLPASGKPVLANENTRPDRDGNLAHHEDAAAACALLIAGSCFHSASGKRSSLFTAADRPFAEAFVRGAKSVNLEFQDGRYAHPIELETAADLRVYQRILGDGSRETVRVRR